MLCKHLNGILAIAMNINRTGELTIIKRSEMTEYCENIATMGEISLEESTSTVTSKNIA